ncbi:ATP-binding response regulator [Pseudoduganella namucuonensis]|uniref:ATP-binding response regulator n=1 Tax=Pseudoduganella namucuonensis TaxID=1035707 RepID=UPI0015A66DC4|nr:AAA family ATPase [Pseudoduganella namucuonensis]
MRDADYTLYRVRAPDGAKPRLARTPASDAPGAAGAARLEHEYALRDKLDPQWAVCPLALVRRDDRPMLLLADPGGEPLENLLGAPMAPGLFLRIAGALAAALAGLHQRGIVHKDIKPANALVDVDGGAARWMGFGVAIVQPRERQPLARPEDVAGTLAYMAPEQTGRMNRSIDARSDLYGLGVTFYRMLAGELPFTATDPMELFHCHLARQAAPPAERVPGLPAALSDIVMKLLSKAAEERYQTAAGLEADLRHCLLQWQARERIEPFALGAHDASAQLLIPEKLYGREGQTGALVAAFERVATAGAPELVLVSGYAGIGKSSLVGELHKALVPRRALFATGKFDQYQRDIPYATLSQAFRALVRQLLGQSETRVARWRQRLRAALGVNGQLVVELVPELELLIGPQPPVQELPRQDAHRRFQTVVLRFLGVFARERHPLVLFLDDLQWLDSATLELLEQLVTQPEPRHLLLIGAYRDNEVDELHPLTRTLDAMRRAGRVPRHDIVLAPLALDDVARLLSDTLRGARRPVAPLAALVHAKTDGNPFFTIQFIAALADEGLLAFDPAGACWRWDVARIRAKGYTDNVADLMLGKLHRLAPATRSLLTLLACLGSGAATADLGLLHGAAPEAVHATLAEAVRSGCVLRSDDGYVFPHDRVREAAYSLVAAGERAVLHLRIGRLLAARTPPGELERHVFEIANQFNRGAGLIDTVEERERLAELNLMAGRRAQDATAYAAALGFLAAGCALLAPDDWERRHPLRFALALRLAECEYLTGDLAAAERRLSELSARAAGRAELAAVTCALVNLFTTLDRSDRAVEAGLDYLRRVGVDWAPHPAPDEVRQEFARIWLRVGERPIEELVDLPLMRDPDEQATMDVLTTILPPALFTDENLLGMVVGRIANLSLEHGHSDGSCLGYCWLGMFLGPRFGDYRAGFRFAKLGLDLVDQRGLGRFKARVYVHFGNVVAPWSQPFQSGRAWVRRAFDVANENGDLTFALYSCNHLVTNLLACGEPLEQVQREAEHGLEFARKARFGLVVDILTGQSQLIRALRGVTPELASLNDDGFDEERFERHLEGDPRLAIAACWYWIRKLQARCLAGDHAAAVAAAANAERLLWTSPSHIEVAEYHFYAALARAAHYDQAGREERARHLTALAAHRRQLDEWRRGCPENFATRAALVGAEIARIEGHELDAMRLYEQAARAARDNGLVHNQALAYERAAAFHRARGFELVADTYLREARDCYARWGADGKVRQLEALHGSLRARSEAPPAAPLAQLDMLSVAKATQAISGRIVLDELVDTLMRIVLENAGAQSGAMLLVRDGKLALVADIHVARRDVNVRLRRGAEQAPGELPETILNYVRRSGETVLLADAAALHPYAGDAYFSRHRPKSVLCLPIVRQGALIGLLYLENNLVTHAFTPARVTVLELLACQAAISLENAQLYTDLREREARIRRLVEANIIGIFFWDVRGAINDANDAFLDMVGYSRDDLRAGKLSWSGLTPGEYNELDRIKVAQLGTVGACAQYEKEFIRKDGGRVPVLIGGTMLEGSLEQGLAFVLDLTERRQAEAERAARKSADAANAAKSAFLSSMSHELRSPLNTLLGFARLMERQPALPEETRADLAIILRSGEHLRALINQVLDLAKIEAGRMVLDIADFDLHAMLDELEEMFALKARGRELSLRFELDGAPRFVRGDPLKLRQVLINLLDNAIKFTERGEVALRVRTPPGEERLAFAVADTGIGISAAELGQLGTAFVRAGGALREGTGLGLAITRNFVRLMGGELLIASEPGRGTTAGFSVELPAVGAESALVEPLPRRVVALAPGQPRYRVMVVDDRGEARQLLMRLLAPLGFEVREACDGQQAVDLWRAWPAHLIWMDMRMPVMDGRAATRRIKASHGGAATVIIALTASSFEEERADILAAGCDDFLRKPFHESDLFALMQKHLGVRFIHQEEEGGAAAAPAASPDAGALAALPAALRGALEQALVQLDTAAVTAAIAEVGDASLAHALATLANEFQYTRILRLLQGANQKELP